MQVFSAVVKILLTNKVAEIEKEEVEFPCCVTLWQESLTSCSNTLFLLSLYTMFSCVKKMHIR